MDSNVIKGVDPKMWPKSLVKVFNGPTTKKDRCGFGYDSSTDDYVIVNLTIEGWRTEVHCFSLRTNSWSRILGTAIYFPLDCGNGVFFNGALHWFGRLWDGHRQAVITSFDVTERGLFEIPLPPDFAVKDQICDLRVMEGCLCLCGANIGRETTIWMMKGHLRRWTI